MPSFAAFLLIALLPLSSFSFQEQALARGPAAEWDSEVAAPGVHGVTSSRYGTPTADSPEQSGQPARVPVGSWGGKHVHLEVTEEGATIEFDCAHGKIDGVIKLEKDGSFRIKGSFVTERPGPQREGEEPPARPADYSGRVADREMELNVLLEDTEEDLGTFTLVLGQDSRLRKCR